MQRDVRILAYCAMCQMAQVTKLQVSWCCKKQHVYREINMPVRYKFYSVRKIVFVKILYFTY